MRFSTIASAALLGLSSAALAQIATPGDPKLGNAPAGNGAASNTGNAADAPAPAGNTPDPGKS